jgi:hypothetical protein
MLIRLRLPRLNIAPLGSETKQCLLFSVMTPTLSLSTPQNQVEFACVFLVLAVIPLLSIIFHRSCRFPQLMAATTLLIYTECCQSAHYQVLVASK